jgi:hypothetical protein
MVSRMRCHRPLNVSGPSRAGFSSRSLIKTKAVPVHSGCRPPAQNVWKRQQYDYLLRTNGDFRAYRMKKECGPIRDHPGLRGSCVASFSAYEPVRQ